MVHQTLGGPLVSSIPLNFLRDGVVNRRAMYSHLVDNRVLREDETRQIEEALTRVARRDLVAVARLRAAGLTVPLRNIGVTSYEFDRISPVGKATQSMSILNLGDRDLVTFARTAVPVPVTASQFELDARKEAAGRTTGEPVSLTNVEEHTRAVAETLEDTLTNGSDVVLGANTLPGYTNFGSRQQVTLGTAWDQLSPGAIQTAVSDVLAMRQALRDTGFSGPYHLHVPSNWDGVLDEDYKAESDRTLRERLMAITGVEDIFVNPALPDDNALLVQMTSSVVQAAIGQDVTTVTWDRMGGLAMHWAILAVMSFAIKAAVARAPLSQGTLPSLTTSSGIAHLA